jgi:hypothetical protein
MEDGIHEGYFIPKGSFIIPNIWSVLSALYNERQSGHNYALQETYTRSEDVRKSYGVRTSSIPCYRRQDA